MGSGQSLTEARYGALAATLPSGQVLIAGGYNASGYLTSAELFNPVTDTFTEAHRQRPVAHRSTLWRARGDAALRRGPDRGRLQRQQPPDERGTVQPRYGHLHEAHGQRPSRPPNHASFGVAATLPSGEVLIAGGQNRTSRSVNHGTVQSGDGHLHEAHGQRPVAHRSTLRSGRGDATLRPGPDRGRRQLQGQFPDERGTPRPGDGHLHEAHRSRPVAHRSTQSRRRGDAALRRGPDRGRLQHQQRLSRERGTVQPADGHLHEAHGQR